MKNERVNDLVLMGMYLAMFYVLDVVGNMIPFFQMPEGGSLGISTIPLILASYHLGWKKGTVVSLLAVVLMFMSGKVYVVQRSDGFSLFMIALQFIMEYPVAFGVYGLSSLFPNFDKFYSGVMVTNLIRLAIHVVAGVVYWQTPWWGSFTYNGWYMIPTMILGLVLIPLIVPRLDKMRH